MFQINENYQKLPGSYLFSAIAKKVAAYSEKNPDKPLIRLGIGDVTQPIAPAIIEAMHKAVDEMGQAETFHGYAPDLGYALPSGIPTGSGAWTLPTMKFLSRTGQKAILQIFRKFLQWKIKLRSAILSIRCMWIRM